jgi:hypothetical protein
MDPKRPEPNGGDANIIAFKEAQKKARRAAMPKSDPQEERSRTRANIAALVFAALLIAVGWMLVQKLGASGRLEDCLMSGRTNCAPIQALPNE